MIKYIKGDLFTTTTNIIAHGCNCKGGFGSGIAGIISKIHPEVKTAYLQKFQSEGWNLGEIQVVKVSGKPYQYIVNCATQLNYGSPRAGVVYVNYDAVRHVMKELLKISIENNFTISIPKIGAGLAAGDWGKIEKIINDIFKDKEILVFEKD